jgi:hypothetical protein
VAAAPKSAPATRRAGARPSGSAEPTAVATPPDDAAAIAGPAAGADASRLARAAQDTRIAPGREFAGAALIVLAGVTAGLAIVRIRRARTGRSTGRRPGIR